MDAKDQKMVKVKILKPVGPYQPGEEVEVPEEMAVHLCDGVKAMKADDFAKSEAAKNDPSKMSVKEMKEAGVKNVVGPDVAIYAQAEQAALNGKPVAASEPITVTGGITPPTLVHPAMAKSAGHPVTELKDVKGLEKKAEDKKADEKNQKEKK